VPAVTLADLLTAQDCLRPVDDRLVNVCPHPKPTFASIGRRRGHEADILDHEARRWTE
jgi:hypothetical protein